MGKKTSKLRLNLEINEMVFDVIDNLSPFTPYQKTPKTPANQKVVWNGNGMHALMESTTSPAVDSMFGSKSAWWMTSSYNDTQKHPNPILAAYTPSSELMDS